MEFFEDFITTRFSFVSKIKIELLLLSFAALFIIVSAVFFLSVNNVNNQKEIVIDEDVRENAKEKKHNTLFIDIGGAVEKSGMHEFSTGSRLKDALVKAGGLSLNADRDFFSKNFNLARILQDEEKIYIPTLDEVSQGYVDRKATLVDTTNGRNEGNNGKKISINTASQKQLETLPAVGEVTASKIVAKRPYGSLEELLEKKIVSESTFEKIKELIEL